MKIIGVSNFDLDVDDFLICENICNEFYGKIILKALIESMNENDTYYYRLVEDNYKLYVFNP